MAISFDQRECLNAFGAIESCLIKRGYGMAGDRSRAGLFLPRRLQITIARNA